MSVVIRRLQGQHSTPSNKLRILLNEQHNVLLKKALEDEEAAQLTVEILYVALAISSLMEVLKVVFSSPFMTDTHSG